MSLRVVAGAAVVVGLAAPAWAGGSPKGHYQRHKHYEGDPRDAIYRIDRRNHLGGSVLVPGERLVLPSAG